jgi:hypothetical protein
MLGLRLSWLIPVVTFAIGAGGMFYLQHEQQISFAQDITENDTNYRFINPILFCQDQAVSGLSNAISNKIESQVTDYINQKKDSGELVDAAMYYRDLNTGPWAIVNRRLMTAPSSLLKVPLAISIYKHSESENNFLTKTLTYSGGSDVDQGQHFAPPDRPHQNFAYNIEDLVKFAVVDSDNTSVFLLSKLLSDEELKDSYEKLGIPPPTTDKGEYQLDVRTIASYFRVLYNASYLNQADSEHLLGLLSKSTFTQGIVAGLPSGVVVSHKFGEAKFPDNKLQLTDCGIVYRPTQPYLLCVVTHGNDFDKLAPIIANISKIVWDALEQK